MDLHFGESAEENVRRLTDQYLRPQALSILERWYSGRTITLYDQFGRPVYVPSGKKIGQTIEVRRPYRFTDQA